ncbi:efflux RND transporter periplasmic adaptor subunit [Archangium minus]|uniref:Efflux RND transporter periplasmic adaptor subunit n=1 Tax=Archangium minus TaxID=83450 RepID=A0ABY9X8R0_9BACT|nr:efflux RND transporter periplasmic adaptor subunit [Archangium minus]
MSTHTSSYRSWLGPLLWSVGLVVVALVFRGPLVDWFTGARVKDAPAREAPAATAHEAHGAQGHEQAQGPTGPALPTGPLPGVSVEYARAAFEATERMRLLLANDSLEGLDTRAREVAAALRAVAAELKGAEGTKGVESGAEAAERLAETKNLDEARARFGEVTRVLVGLAEADARLREGWHVFQCPMEKGFNKWVQRNQAMENPYMGRRMLACGVESEWKVAAKPKAPAPAPGEIAHYTCPMHPSVKQAGPGQCPICGMDLTPVTREELESGTVLIDSIRRQRIGVKTAPVKVGPMDLSVTALGRVTYDETALVDVTLKLDGYIHELHVDATGQPVKKGQALFTLYSPELYAAQQEYLLALKSQSAAKDSGAPERMDSLVHASRKRLELWGLTGAQLDAIAKKGAPIENLPFLAPASGYVLEKSVVAGAAVRAGDRLYRIAPLDKVWVEADVYESDLPRVKVGQEVMVTLPYLPGRTFKGRVGYIYPALQASTRTGRIRVELKNPELELKPDMYAEVQLKQEGGSRLQVPESAVLYTGPRRLVFVDLGEGRLAPREVKLGVHAGESYEVLEGLKEGEVVVTSGNFLVAAESRIRSAADHWSGGDHESH